MVYDMCVWILAAGYLLVYLVDITIMGVYLLRFNITICEVAE